MSNVNVESLVVGQYNVPESDETKKIDDINRNYFVFGIAMTVLSREVAVNQELGADIIADRLPGDEQALADYYRLTQEVVAPMTLPLDS